MMPDDDEFDYVGPPLSDDEVNEVLVRLEEDDVSNWKWQTPTALKPEGYWYYVGPSIAGDGSIDWPGDALIASGETP